MSYKCHLFVCTNAPEKAGKCGSKQSEELRRKLKERSTAAFGKEVRVNASGCLGFCEKGIAAVLYPRGQWFFDLKNSTEDENKLFEALSQAQGR